MTEKLLWAIKGYALPQRVFTVFLRGGEFIRQIMMKGWKTLAERLQSFSRRVPASSYKN